MSDKLTEDERFARLPKWAQYRIRTLESTVERLTELVEEQPPSDTCIANYTMPDKYLPDGERIRFYLNNDKLPYDRRKYVEARVRGNKLNLMASDSLVVWPHVTNVINVGVEDR